MADYASPKSRELFTNIHCVILYDTWIFISNTLSDIALYTLLRLFDHEEKGDSFLLKVGNSLPVHIGTAWHSTRLESRKSTYNYNFISQLHRVYSRSGNSWTLKMKVLLSFETPRTDYKLTQCRSPEEQNAQAHRCENLKPRVTDAYRDSPACYVLLLPFASMLLFSICFLRTYTSRVRVGSSCFRIREVIFKFRCGGILYWLKVLWSLSLLPGKCRSIGLAQIRAPPLPSTSFLNHCSLISLTFFLSFSFFVCYSDLILFTHCRCRRL